VIWPRLSVIIPVRNGAATLPRVLTSLLASDLPRDTWELIVVDDASTDGTLKIAAALANQLLRVTDGPRGPAAARNRGAEVARGDILVFIDADVCVHSTTLRGFLRVLDEAPDVGAVFGAYDLEPSAPGLMSQYRNLVHHYTHVMGAGDAETFWAGCGAVRKRVFREVGGFNAARYTRPQIEDVELGHRIRDHGYRILLRPELQGKHLKGWSLGGSIVTDVRDRGIPWTRLLLSEGGTVARRSTLNLRTEEKLFTLMVAAAMLLSIVAFAAGEPWWMAASASLLLGVVVGNARLLRWFARQRGIGFALAVIPLRILYYFLNGLSAGTGWLQRALTGH